MRGNTWHFARNLDHELFCRSLSVRVDPYVLPRYLNLHNDEDIQILLELTKDDPLAKEELREKQIAEKLVVTAAKLISPYVSETFDAGINWCIDCTRSSRHSNLVPDMEIIKAVTFLKMKELNKAVQTLKTFEKVESRMQSAAATNLSFLYFREMQHAQADKYADQVKYGVTTLRLSSVQLTVFRCRQLLQISITHRLS